MSPIQLLYIEKKKNMIINKYQYRKQHVLHYRQSREKKDNLAFVLYIYIYTQYTLTYLMLHVCMYVEINHILSRYIRAYSSRTYTHTHAYIYIYMCVCVCVCVYVSKRRNEDEEGACPRKATIMTTDHYHSLRSSMMM